MTETASMAFQPDGSGGSSSKALLFDYRQAANPIRRGLTEPIPQARWGADLHRTGPSAVLPLDLSAALGCASPATSPALCANFVRILAGESLVVGANATSSLFYVLQGDGHCQRAASTIAPAVSQSWSRGDLFVLPAGADPELSAAADSVLYWVHDAPLLQFLGVSTNAARFEFTHYPADWLRRVLDVLAADPSSVQIGRAHV